MITAPMTMVFAFLAATASVYAAWIIIYHVALRYAYEVDERLRDHDRQSLIPRSDQGELFRDMDSGSVAHKSLVDTLRGRYTSYMAQAGLQWTPVKTVVLVLACSALVSVLAGVVTKSYLFGLLGWLIGASAPLCYVARKHQQRMTNMFRQLPLAFAMMSRAVRAGQTIPAAVALVADDLGGPIGEEFGILNEQQNLGMPTDAALRDLAQRVGVLEMRMFAIGMIVQARSGGRLSELLDNLASIARNRIMLKERVKAYTSEGRAQANVLIVLPVAAFFTLILLAPDYIQELIDRPQVLLQAAGAQLLGAAWIRHIANFEY